jgi:hypothetical protein
MMSIFQVEEAMEPLQWQFEPVWEVRTGGGTMPGFRQSVLEACPT